MLKQKLLMKYVRAISKVVGGGTRQTTFFLLHLNVPVT